jgi:hypothetical protein
MNSSKIKLSVIVLFYHGERWIEPCVRSLENQTLSRNLYEIVMVDNGGSTPSVDKYEEQKNINVIHFPGNYGFAGGNNRALAYTQGDLVFLINQDVVVHINCLKEVMNAFESYPEAGVISGNMIMVSSDDVFDQNTSAPKTVGMYRISPLGYASYSLSRVIGDVVPVDFVSGNALSFRRIILEDIGNYLFDHRLGSYAEDLDLSIRLNRTGWRMYVCPKAVVYHYRDDAFSGKPREMLAKLVKISANRLIVYYNNLTSMDLLKKFPALLLGIPFKAARPDGDRRFHTLKFMVALMAVPLIFIFSVLKIYRFSR